MTKRPCKNCGMFEEQHQKDGPHDGMCEFERLSPVMQEEINAGNIIPDCDWEWISYQPMSNLEWLEWKSNEDRLE